MEIKFLEIYGYGKWIDEGFELSPDLQVFYGKNEAGKTTLMSFIHSILFGFPSRNSQKLRYESKESSRYGGKIHFRDNRLGDGVVERTAGKSSGDVKITLENGAVGEDGLAKELVHNIDRNLYQQLFSFHLEDLEAIGQINNDDINRYFVSVGVLGSKEYMSLADRLDQKAAKLFKPSGKVPEINKQLKVLNKQNKKLARARDKNDEYLSLVKEVESINDTLAEINKQQDQNYQKMEQLKEVEKDWEVKVEMDELEKEIERYSISNLPEDGIYQLKQVNSDIERIRENQRENQNKLQGYQKEYQPSEMFIAYEENKSKVQTTWAKLPYLFQQQKELNERMVEKRYLDQNLSKEIAKEDIDKQNELPIIWSGDEDKKIEKWRSDIHKIDKTITENEKEYDYLSYQLDSEQKEVDELEKNLTISNSSIEETELAKKNPNSKSSQLLMAVGIGIGGLGSFVFNSEIRWLFLFITAALVVLFFNQLKKRKKQEETVGGNQQSVSYAEIKNMWRNKLAQMDAHIEKQNQLKNQDKELNESKKLIETNWFQFKNNYLLPSHVNIKDAADKKEKYKEIRQLDNKSSQLADKINMLEEDIEKEIESLNFIYEFFPVQKDIDSKLQSINHFINKIKDEEQYLEEYIRESDYIQKELGRLYKEEEQYFNNKTALLQSVNVKSEEAFRELFEQLGEKERKISRLNDLKERHQSFKDVKNFTKRTDIQTKIEEYEHLQQQSAQKEREMIETKAEINYDLEKLETGYEFTTLLQDFENEKNILHELVQTWASRRVASMLIKNTLNYGTEDQLPQVLEDAEKYFSLLTNGRYKQIFLTEDGIKVSDSLRSFYASELSRGTAEPLYVALRFGFIKNISQTLSLPIIIDDGFVNFDESRKEAVYTLLKEMSQYVQVLYFTFDDKITDYVEESQMTVLK